MTMCIKLNQNWTINKALCLSKLDHTKYLIVPTYSRSLIAILRRFREMIAILYIYLSFYRHLNENYARYAQVIDLKSLALVSNFDFFYPAQSDNNAL